MTGFGFTAAVSMFLRCGCSWLCGYYGTIVGGWAQRAGGLVVLVRKSQTNWLILIAALRASNPPPHYPVLSIRPACSLDMTS